MNKYRQPGIFRAIRGILVHMSNQISRRSSLLALSAASVAMARPSPADLDRVQVGQAPPDFDLPSAAGGKVSLRSLRGKNVVLVFYRGYW